MPGWVTLTDVDVTPWGVAFTSVSAGVAPLVRADTDGAPIARNRAPARATIPSRCSGFIRDPNSVSAVRTLLKVRFLRNQRRFLGLRTGSVAHLEGDGEAVTDRHDHGGESSVRRQRVVVRADRAGRRVPPPL